MKPIIVVVITIIAVLLIATLVVWVMGEMGLTSGVLGNMEYITAFATSLLWIIGLTR